MDKKEYGENDPDTKSKHVQYTVISCHCIEQSKLFVQGERDDFETVA